uniref:Uncharacterized protein n=1 Tax=Glossina morsitans morsitans TaxID=37546 RepID=A0A1B0FIH0_GLOMM
MLNRVLEEVKGPKCFGLIVSKGKFIVSVVVNVYNKNKHEVKTYSFYTVTYATKVGTCSAIRAMEQLTVDEGDVFASTTESVNEIFTLMS